MAEPAPRGIAAAAPRFVEARPYRFSDRPTAFGRIEEQAYGGRAPFFAGGDDQARRIAAAEAAGYLVVRARSVRFPDGRSLRTYRPYTDEDDLD